MFYVKIVESRFVLVTSFISQNVSVQGEFVETFVAFGNVFIDVQ